MSKGEHRQFTAEQKLEILREAELIRLRAVIAEITAGNLELKKKI